MIKAPSTDALPRPATEREALASAEIRAKSKTPPA
jgi:hypothetical protein